MECESLDREDVLEIMNNTFTVEKKRGRLKASEEKQRKAPTAPDASNNTHSGIIDTPTPQQI